VQTWQLFPVVMLLAVGGLVYVMRGKMQGAATQMYTEHIAQLRAECAARRRPGESDPVCLIAMTKSMFESRLFFVGLTDQQLVLHEPPAAARAFDRPTVSLAVKKKSFADIGNTTATYSSGWEAQVTLPGGESHAWRIYEVWDGYGDQAANVAAFRRATTDRPIPDEGAAQPCDRGAAASRTRP
jgi:hypothetical protein